MDRTAYECNEDAYSLMDAETLVHYIAGYMRLALSSKYSDGGEFFIYFAGSDRFVAFCNLLTPPQRRYVIQFVDHYIQSDEYTDEDRAPYAANREQILRTLG